MTVSAAEMIPFAEALDGASISVERLDDILEYTLLIGNGDINGLVYTDSGNVEIVLTKNDVWDARLEQFRTADTPDAETGETDGVRWLHQAIPGDLDLPGMEFAVALADVGQRQAVTMVTSLESNDVVVVAVKEAQAVVQANAARLIRGH